MMQNSLLYLLLIFLCLGCSQKEELIGAENQHLKIVWESHESNFSRVYLFETEEDYKNHIVKPGYETYARLIKPKPGYFFNRESHFFDFGSFPYYIKIFSASPSTGFIEHNQNFTKQFQYPLIENSRTLIEMKTQYEKVKSANIELLEFYNLGDNLNLEPGKTVIYTFELHRGSVQNPNVTIIETKEIQSHDGKSVIIEPTSSTISNFRTDDNQKYYVNLRTLTGQKITRQIDLFKQLNLIKLYTNEFNISDDNGESGLKLKVRWIK